MGRARAYRGEIDPWVNPRGRDPQDREVVLPTMRCSEIFTEVFECKGEASARPMTSTLQDMKLTYSTELAYAETCGTNSNVRHNRVPRALHSSKQTAPLPYLN